MTYDPVKFILKFLGEGGASRGQLMLARERAIQMIEAHGGSFYIEGDILYSLR